jgi:hypothetical protein
VKKHDTCKVCGKVKVYPKTRYVVRAEYERDEYCSRQCCEEDQKQKEAAA